MLMLFFLCLALGFSVVLDTPVADEDVVMEVCFTQTVVIKCLCQLVDH